MVKLKLILVMVVIAFVLYSIQPFMGSVLKIKNEEMTTQQYVTVNSQQKEIVIEMEAYLVGVVAAEMPVNFELEALKAQAIASRTFVASRNYLVDDTTMTQVYQDDEKLKEKWKEQYDTNISKIRQAVIETEGQVLKYKNELISATFFSSSNGKTNNSEDYWNGSIAYLKSVDSHWDHQKKDNIRTKNMTWEQLSAIFSTIVDEVEVISRYENGYVKEVRVNQSVMSGRKLRELLELASSSFEVECDERGVTITTVGSGHGVGMSQYGAQGMALEGYRYDEILKHYYSDVEILNK